MMLICIKQHISNIWSSIHKKVKQHWGWVEKNIAYKLKVHTFKNIVDSLYLDYPLSRKFLYPKLLPWSLEHFHHIHLNFIFLSWTSLSWTSLYLKQSFRSRCNYFLPISNFLLACSVIQVSYRVIYQNTVGSLYFKHPGDLEFYLRMRISQQFEFSVYSSKEKF